ncbi:prepilin-type N-terminal cleavage/methylation domain-containing protein [Shewanella putrefaciens]|uniref:Prepilin-type N-terminal cleavage/methylation domain-containing protein n=1 Tax=Shewanella putrefaciens TaxID=24 RepID=A0ABX8XCV9_SHEPU|nr:prepilin-type N-terminal cleavage/methylation domain-containing protein [Shewanella putrefaciens]MCT8944641.1 prepilin-type N-terminal cleavage/methylation domain-containing protein [Shewanella putrefaciens]QSE49846.1 prepilin-type N-terminal cleavage/methylation domain-containing protein [Shewanella putrefaciens]QYX73255.1 prepilin-type N-terminal cleavage/methylation domain-containing protein [Shewanella putrefaciens]GGN30068.1 MSHA biogenesis protein MshB [Shewanella putrefaciens]
MKTKQNGFSLIELVIVIVILGLLAATAIPRFLNVTDDAQDASVDGVAGGLSTAVSFVRSQWEVDGRRNNNVLLDGTSVNLDTRFGYPTGTSVTDATVMTDASCQEVFNTVLQSAPRNVLYTQDTRNQRYTVRVIDGAGGSATSIAGATVTGLDLCVYHQVASLVVNQTTGVATPTPDLSTAGAKGVVYNPGTGRVLSFTQTPFTP